MTLVQSTVRIMPDGNPGRVHPYHISFEGLEKNIICRDASDCDSLVKCLFVCSVRKNVIIIVYAVVSNHAHLAILAKSHKDAYDYAQEVKRTYSMLFRVKYKEQKVLKGTSVDVQMLDTPWYLRNALAYILRNAYDNGANNLNDYKWCGYSAMFRNEPYRGVSKPVASMTKRERENIMHTGDDLKAVSWCVNADNELIPATTCDAKYLEQAFNNDQAFFFKSIGTVNTAEMTQKLVLSPRQMKTDSDFLKDVEELSIRWFGTNLAELSTERKARLLMYVYRSTKTTVAQLARTFNLDQESIRILLNK